MDEIIRGTREKTDNNTTTIRIVVQKDVSTDELLDIINTMAKAVMKRYLEKGQEETWFWNMYDAPLDVIKKRDEILWEIGDGINDAVREHFKLVKKQNDEKRIAELFED